MSDSTLFTLRTLKEQGTLRGDLTLVQELALRLVMMYEDGTNVSNMEDVVKSLQAFIDPKLYAELYKDELQQSNPEEIPEGAEVADVMVDVSDPDSLEDYLMYAFEQTKVQNSKFAQGSQTIQLKGIVQ